MTISGSQELACLHMPPVAQDQNLIFAAGSFIDSAVRCTFNLPKDLLP